MARAHCKDYARLPIYGKNATDQVAIFDQVREFALQRAIWRGELVEDREVVVARQHRKTDPKSRAPAHDGMAAARKSPGVLSGLEF